MSLPAVADVREAARLERLHRDLRREESLAGATCRGNRAWRWAFAVPLPWLWRWVLLPGVTAAVVVSTSLRALWLMALVILLGTRGSGTIEVTPFLALHAGDRRAVLLARWRALLPEVLWTGVAWAASVVLRKGEAPPVHLLPALAAVALLPAFVSAARMRWRSLRFAPGLPTTLAVAGACGVAGGALFAGGDPKAQPLGGALTGIAGLVAAAAIVVPSMRGELAREWARRGETGLLPRVAGNVAVAALTLGISFVGVVMLGKDDDLDRAWESSRSGRVLAVGIGAVVAEVALVALFVRNALRDLALRDVPHVERGPESASDVPPQPVAPLPGAGLRRLRWAEFRDGVPRAWLGRPLWAVWTARGPLLGAAAVAFPLDGSSSALWLALVAAFVAPRLVEVTETPRLHLFGVEWREMALHNLRALVLVAALPTLAGAGAALAVLGPTPSRGATLAVIACGFLMRAAASGIGRVFWKLGCLAEVALLAAWAASLVWRVGIEGSFGSADPGTALWLAAGLALPALAALPAVSWLRSEAKLRDDARS